jgi:hypothetical protein
MKVLGVATLVLAAVACQPARAATPQPQTGSEPAPPSAEPAPPSAVAAAPPPEHRGLSLLLNAGAYQGFGAGLAFGSRDLGVRASAGWAPLLVALRGTGTELKFYSALLVSSDLYLRILSPRPTSQIGGVMGYRYSSLLGHGLAVGGYAQFALSRAIDLSLSGGFLVFPDGEGRLKRDQNLPSSTSFSFPGPNVNFALGAGLAFFP